MSMNAKQIADKNRIKRFMKIYIKMKKDPEIKEEKLIISEKGIKNLMNDYKKKYGNTKGSISEAECNF